MDKSEMLKKLHAADRENRHLERILALLQWDEETYLPGAGVEDRAGQMAALAGIAHGRLISEETGSLLSSLGSTPENPDGDERLAAPERDFLKVLRRDYDRAVKLPCDFVSAAARAEGLSQAAWVNAKRDNNFSAFLPHLVRMIEFSRKKAEYWGFADNPYDGLLDFYEPEMNEKAETEVFAPLKRRLSVLLKKIAGMSRPDTSFLEQDFNVETQSLFSHALMAALGFDTRRGRLDVSAHPFTTTLGSDDVRITTRYLPRKIESGIFSTIHECGHAFYELGFPAEIRGSRLADGASMGIHESQSRFWENVIGRSRAFWDAMFPLLASFFPGALSPVTASIGAEDFYRAINIVEPSFIRTEADEVTYSLHIVLRFQLESELFSGRLDPADLPSAWKLKMKELLGIEPETDTEGVLQDVHWSLGLFGYFPSYALGNLYALQFWEKLKSDIPDVGEKIAQKNFAVIHSWLKENIFVYGRRLEPSGLLQKVTGKSLSPEPFLSYIESKYAGIYGF